MQVYLDNSATTRQYDQVTDTMIEMMRESYGNPSSLHLMGVEAEKKVRASRKIFASAIGASEDEVYFTSGGTESDNMALIGCAMANRRAGNHLITTAIEHPAVLSAMATFDQAGIDDGYLDEIRRGDSFTVEGKA